MRVATGLADLDAQVVECRRCLRLVQWREEVARVKRASYAAEDYWGRPVPGFGAEAPKIWVVGLAPAAHGANRTGRMFTGDRSGDWLFGSLHRVGLASQATSVRIDDGQVLRSVRLTAAVHCAPPGNKPTREEFAACAAWLRTELDLVAPTVRVVVALGGLAWSAVLAAMRGSRWQVPRPAPRFGHGAEVGVTFGDRQPTLIGAYHPSQQNTFTGRLTEPMIDEVLGRAAQLAAS